MEPAQVISRARGPGTPHKSLLTEWLGTAGRERRAVFKALARLSADKTPVRAEAEQTGLSFYTLLTLRRDALLIARPYDLRSGLPKNGHVRLTLPNTERKQVRVPILVPHLQMDLSARHVCVCGVPTEFSGTCKRATDRLCTTQFRNLHLQLPSQNKTFRIVDLSASGLRIYVASGEDRALLEPDTELRPANLRVGASTSISLESIIPRAISGNTVGMEMQVQRDGISERTTINLLNRLQLVELQRLRSERV